MTRLRGVALLGPPPASVVGEVPHEAYLDAVIDDATWIINGGIVESPFYGVLNLCRTLHLVLDDPERCADPATLTKWLRRLTEDGAAVVCTGSPGSGLESMATAVGELQRGRIEWRRP